VILRIAYDDDAASASFYLGSFGNALRSVVGAFGVEVGPDFADDGANVVFGKDDDGIDIGERGQNLRALLGWDHGAAFSFQRADGVIGIHSDNYFASEFARSVQITDVPDVEHVETAVGECDSGASAAPFADAFLQLAARENLGLD
jgi:hypothetical protein